MAALITTLEETRTLIHQEGSGHLFIPVPGTTRYVQLFRYAMEDDCMYIFTSRPTDIISSQVLSVWGDQPLPRLWLQTARSDDKLGPLHTPSREEWESFLHCLSQHMPTLTGEGWLMIFNDSQTESWYDDLLACLPPSLPGLMSSKGVRAIMLDGGAVSGKAVLAFMTTLQQKGWPVEDTGRGGCKVMTLAGEMVVALHGNRVVGDRATLDDVGNLYPTPLYDESFEEAQDGEHHDEAMRLRQIEADFNKALEEGEAETCRGRLVLLGRAGVGKTSVINALLGKEFSSNYAITDLLDVHYVTIDNKGMWQSLDESAMRKHDEFYLAALAMEQNKRETTIEGSQPVLGTSQDEGATAGSAGIGVYKQEEQDDSAHPLMVKEDEEEAEPPKKKRKHEELPTEVKNLVLEGKELAKKDSMFVWDFAGQLVYYTVHQLFLTERSIILLVVDGSNDLQGLIPPEYTQASDYFKMTEKEYVEYFLKTANIWVRSEKDDSEARQPCRPPHVYLLLNKADLVSPEELKKRLDLVRKLVKETPGFHDMVREVLPFTSNPEPEHEECPQLTSYEESCSKLKDCLQLVKQDFVDKVPIKWLRLKNKLQEKSHTSFHDAAEIATTLQIEEDTVKSALQYFHQHRELVYWDTEGFRDFVICQPNWLINEMRKIITVKEYQIHDSHRSPEVTSLLHLLNDDKILNESLAKELWKENHEVMIKIMQKYLLLLPWSEDSYGRCQYLVPCLLEAMKDTDYIQQGKKSEPDIPPIYFFLVDKVIPIGLTSRLVTLLATEKGWRDGDEMTVIFFNGARYFLTENGTNIDITLKEIVWRPTNITTPNLKEQAVIEVRAKMTGKVSQEKLKNTSRCLNGVRCTILDGISVILSMINVTDQVQTAVQSECQHKLQIPNRETWENVCNICREEYDVSKYRCWYGKELTVMKEDQRQASGGAGRPLRTGELSQIISQLYRDIGKDGSSKSQELAKKDIAREFVHDEENLKRFLDEVKPELLKYIDIDPLLIAELQVYHLLDPETEQKLKLSSLANLEKVDKLMAHITRDTRNRLLPFLLALEATGQTRMIEELDTEGIRQCLRFKS